MAKRKRKRRRRRPGAAPPQNPRADASTPVPAEDEAGREAKRPAEARRASGKGAPPAPWGSFPLSELVVLIAIVLLVAGFIVSPPRGPIMIGTGILLGSLAGLELAAREHFAGYKSHTLLLASSAGAVTAIGLVLVTSASRGACAAVGAVVFAGTAYLFGRAFKRRSGGSLFRLRA